MKLALMLTWNDLPFTFKLNSHNFTHFRHIYNQTTSVRRKKEKFSNLFFFISSRSFNFVCAISDTFVALLNFVVYSVYLRVTVISIIEIPNHQKQKKKWRKNTHMKYFHLYSFKKVELHYKHKKDI